MKKQNTIKTRIKWILAGFGFMVGAQVLTTLLFSLLRRLAEASPGTVESTQWALVIFGLTLGTFLLGGFIIGRVEEAPRFYDALLAAALTLLCSTLVYQALPVESRAQFTGGIWLSGGSNEAISFWLSNLLAVPPLVAAALGAYLGYLMTSPVESALERFVGGLGLVGAVLAPVTVLITMGMSLPWYVPLALLVVLLVGIGLSYWFFTRGLHEVDDISIMPGTRR